MPYDPYAPTGASPEIDAAFDDIIERSRRRRLEPPPPEPRGYGRRAVEAGLETFGRIGGTGKRAIDTLANLGRGAIEGDALKYQTLTSEGAEGNVFGDVAGAFGAIEPRVQQPSIGETLADEYIPHPTTVLGGIGRGVLASGADIATDPLTYLGLGGLAKMGKAGFRAGQAAGAAFTGLAAKGAYDQGTRAYEIAREQGLTPEAAEAAVHALVSGGFAGLGAYHLATGKAAEPAAKPGVDAGLPGDIPPPEMLRLGPGRPQLPPAPPGTRAAPIDPLDVPVSERVNRGALPILDAEYVEPLPPPAFRAAADLQRRSGNPVGADRIIRASQPQPPPTRPAFGGLQIVPDVGRGAPLPPPPPETPGPPRPGGAGPAAPPALEGPPTEALVGAARTGEILAPTETVGRPAAPPRIGAEAPQGSPTVPGGITEGVVPPPDPTVVPGAPRALPAIPPPEALPRPGVETPDQVAARAKAAQVEKLMAAINAQNRTQRDPRTGWSPESVPRETLPEPPGFDAAAEVLRKSGNPVGADRLQAAATPGPTMDPRAWRPASEPVVESPASAAPTMPPAPAGEVGVLTTERSVPTLEQRGAPTDRRQADVPVDVEQRLAARRVEVAAENRLPEGHSAVGKILELEDRASQAEAAADVDVRTGLENQNAYLKATAEGQPEPAAVSEFDLAGAGAMNAQFGERYTDATLAAKGDVVRAVVGNRGRTFRKGGDEVVIHWNDAADGKAGHLEVAIALEKAHVRVLDAQGKPEAEWIGIDHYGGFGSDFTKASAALYGTKPAKGSLGYKQLPPGAADKIAAGRTNRGGPASGDAGVRGSGPEHPAPPADRPAEGKPRGVGSTQAGAPARSAPAPPPQAQLTRPPGVNAPGSTQVTPDERAGVKRSFAEETEGHREAPANYYTNEGILRPLSDVELHRLWEDVAQDFPQKYPTGKDSMVRTQDVPDEIAQETLGRRLGIKSGARTATAREIKKAIKARRGPIYERYLDTWRARQIEDFEGQQERPLEEGEAGAEGFDPEDYGGRVEAPQGRYESHDRGASLGMYIPRVLGIVDPVRRASIAARAAEIEAAQGWEAKDEAGIATLLRKALAAEPQGATKTPLPFPRGDRVEAPRAKYGSKPLAGQRGLFGEDIPAPEELPGRAPKQEAMFGGEMLQGTERKGTEGREGEGELFTQERDAQEKALAESQQTIPEPPATDATAELAKRHGMIARGDVGEEAHFVRAGNETIKLRRIDDGARKGFRVTVFSEPVGSVAIPARSENYWSEGAADAALRSEIARAEKRAQAPAPAGNKPSPGMQAAADALSAEMSGRRPPRPVLTKPGKAPMVDAEAPGGKPSRNRPEGPGPKSLLEPERADAEALDTVPPGPVPPAEGGREAGEGGGEGGATDGGGVLRPHHGAGEAIRRPGVGAGEGEVLPPAPGRPGRIPTVRPVTTRLRGVDYRISAQDDLGAGGTVTKARTNIEAIKLLKTILKEDRLATPAEQAELVKYVGWGALSKAFEYDYYSRDAESKTWQGIQQELRELLAEDEYEAARRSTLNAHYTNPEVVTAMWDAVRRLGIPAGAAVLEPAVGAGHFLGLQPESMLPAPRYGVELDKITGNIARLLYPNAAIAVKGYQEAKLPKDFFDLAISNVPFGKLQVHDPAYRKHPKILGSIHNYYFAKALDQVRPGGIVAFITSHFTMDAEDSTVRKYIADRADLLGAIRLPNTAFKGNAGTEVTTDIIFLRRRIEGEPRSGPAFENVGKAGPVHHNEYFVKNPKMILGTPSMAGSMYGGGGEEYTVEGKLEPDAMAKAVARLPEGKFTPVVREVKEPPALESAPEGLKNYAYTIKDGKAFQRQGETLMPVSLAEPRVKQLQSILNVRDSLQSLIQAEAGDSTDAVVDKARKTLNRDYDALVEKHGPLSSKSNFLLTQKDPDSPLLRALEDYNPRTDTATKAPIFSTRTIARYVSPTTAGSPAEALAISLGEHGRVDLPRMQALTGYSHDELVQALTDEGLIFQNPDGRNWETQEEYLSGPVRKKYEIAKAAARADASFDRNEEALKQAQPDDLPPSKIKARLGAGWITPPDVIGFAVETLGLPAWANDRLGITYNKAAASWTVQAKGIGGGVQATEEWGTPRAPFMDLLQDSLNLKNVVIYDKMEDGSRVVNAVDTAAAREKQEKIKAAFEKWVWSDTPRATRLARVYNDTFNDSVPRIYSGAHLKFPGMSRTSLRGNDLLPHQKDAVWRAITMRPGAGLLLNQAVGAGKTFEMIATAMELRRLGLAKKSMVVVPNHLVSEFASQAFRLYPQAKVLILDKPDWEKTRRQEAMSRIATGNWDMVVVPISSFKALPVHSDTLKGFMEEEIAEIENAIAQEREASGDKEGKKSRNPTIKQLEKMKANLEARLEKLLKTAKDDAINFEQLGVDLLIADEAQAYKKIQIPSRATVAGIAKDGSQRAEDMLLKTRWLKRRGGRVIFATATPVTNTMGEVFVMQKFLQPEALESMGISHFDAWRANFGETATSVELSVDGKTYRPKERFSKFVNVGELASMFGESAQTNLASDLKLPVPKEKGGKPILHVAQPTKEQEAYMRLLVKRAAAVKLKKGPPEKGDDNMLVITGDGRKAATDMRLVDKGFHDHPGSKINQAVDTIAEIYKRTTKDNLTQLVFLDLSTPKEGAPPKEVETEADDEAAAMGEEEAGTETAEEIAEEVELYADIRKKLVAQGVPVGEVRFIHEAKNRQQMGQLFSDMNAGRIRVLLASSAKGGVGMNVQRKLYAIHHLDAPWRPDEMEQRDGRIFRQGNENPEVERHRYITKGSFDAFMWQTLERKDAFIKQFWRATPGLREIEDTGIVTLSADDMKAAASGRQEVLEKVTNDAEIRRLENLELSYRDGKVRRQREAQSVEERITRTDRDGADLKAQGEDITKALAAEGTNWTAIVQGKDYDNREAAGAALHQAVVSAEGTDGRSTIGYRLDQPITVSFRPKMNAAGKLIHEPEVAVGGVTLTLNPESAKGTIASLDHAIKSVPRLATDAENLGKILRKKLVDLEELQKQPFEHGARLQELKARDKELLKILGEEKGQESPEGKATRLKNEDSEIALADWLQVRGHRVPKTPGGTAAEKPDAGTVREPESEYGQAREQMEMFLPDGRPYEKPATQAEAIRQAKEATAELAKRPAVSTVSGKVGRDAGSGVRTLGVAIKTDLEQRGWTDLRGKVVKNGQDVAALAQVFRDPRFETFRIIYTKGDTVVGHEGLTSRRPGYVNIFGNKARDLYEIKDRMKRLEADGYYLQHNHPSGRPAPSVPDVRLTETFAKEVPGFKGHIVIDSGEFGFIESSHVAPDARVGDQLQNALARTMVHKMPGPRDFDPLRELGPEDISTEAMEALGEEVTSPEQAAALGRRLATDPNMATLLYLSSGQTVRAIQEMPLTLFKRMTEASNYLHGRSREFGSPKVIAYLPNGSLPGIRRAARFLVEEGSLLDVVIRTGEGRERSLADEGTVAERGMEFGRQTEGQAPIRASEPEGPTDEPPVKAGMVRLYRGEALKGHDAQDDLPANLRWFTRSREVAEDFAAEAAGNGRGGRLVHLDVPESALADMDPYNIRDSKGETLASKHAIPAEDAYVVPADRAGQAKALPLLDRSSGDIVKEYAAAGGAAPPQKPPTTGKKAPGGVEEEGGEEGEFGKRLRSGLEAEEAAYRKGDHSKLDAEMKKVAADARARAGLPTQAEVAATWRAKLTAEADAAKERLRRGGDGKANDIGSAAGKGAETLRDATVVGADLIAKGFDKFGPWAKQMVQALGGTIRDLGKWLSQIFEDARRYVARGKLEADRPRATEAKAGRAGTPEVPGAKPPGPAGEAAQAPAEGSGFTLPMETSFQKFQRIIQDRLNRLGTVEAAIKAQGGKVGAGLKDLFDAVTPIAAEKIRKTQAEYIDPLIKHLADSKLSLKDLDRYVYAKHAPTRNRVIEERWEGEFKDGSGMSDAQAAKILADFDAAGRTPALEKAARFVREMREEQVRTLIEGGLLSKEQAASWREAMGEDYVPLRTAEVDEGIGTGQGFSVSGKEAKHATGRSDLADSPVAAMIQQLHRAIVRAEKNKVDQEFAKFATENKLFELDKEHQRTELTDKGKARTVRDALKDREDFHYKVNGEAHRLDVASVDPILDRALKNMSAKEAGKLVEYAGKFTRFYSQIVTGYNPEFLLTNFARDIQTAVANVSAEASGKIAAQMVKNVPKAIKGMYEALRNPRANSEWARVAGEFRANGGAVGWFSVEDIGSIGKGFERKVGQQGAGALNAALRAARGVKDWIGDANASVEGGVRLAYFKALRDAGLGPREAATAARKVTVDFNKKGEAGPVMNSLYAFFNANVQGAARLGQVLKTPRGAAVAGGIVAASWALDQYNRAAAGDANKDGENDYDSIPEYVKERNLVFMRGEGKNPLLIPMPYGFNVISNVGRQASGILSGTTTAGKAGLAVASSLANAFNPLGSEADLVQQLSPTFLDPIVQHVMNKDFTGKAIRPEVHGVQTKPDSEMYFRNVNPATREIAKWLNEKTGGNKYTPGYIDVSPETIEHFYKFATGGIGTFLGNVAGTAAAVVKGEAPSPRNIPFARRFVYEPREGISSEKVNDYYATAFGSDKMRTAMGEAEYFPQPPQHSITIPGARKPVQLTDAEYAIFVSEDKKMTERLERNIEDSRFARMSAEGRKNFLRQRYAFAATDARRKVMPGVIARSRAGA